jgi:hypothetical protein
VKVSKRLARNHMLPVGVAEYVCPENVTKFEQIRKVKNMNTYVSLHQHFSNFVVGLEGISSEVYKH